MLCIYSVKDITIYNVASTFILISLISSNKILEHIVVLYGGWFIAYYRGL